MRIPASDREDLVHDVLRILLETERLDRRLDEEQVVRYAFGILRHRRALLYRRRLLEASEEFRRNRAQDETANAAPAPIDVSTENERAAIVIQAVSKLPELDRLLLMLRMNDFTFEQIATELGMEPPTVRQRYLRALKKIRDVYFGGRDRAQLD